MAQEQACEPPLEAPEKEDDALTVCENCEHIVPKTMMCLYCGAPILFKMHKKPEE
ncbi:hypothetical protein JXL21_13505 [Candidatus Bathyarchaeota archaeon]|nr:hypothetical protein [Candidatus Bathyarchaeota archaeon]